MKVSYISLDPLINWRNSARPLDWSQIFPKQGPVEVEIGFGQADYLVERASELPEHNFIGIELGWISIKKALRKIAQRGLENVRVIQGDARVIFEMVFKEQSINKVYSLFPCPWPKKRHVKHRLFSFPFLKLVNNRLIREGEAQIVTDFHPYVEWIISEAQDTGFTIEQRLIPPRFRTKYEKKWENEGQNTFYELILRKSYHHCVPIKEEVALKTYRIEEFSPHLFHPRPARNNIVVEFKDQLFDQIRQKAMIRALVVEGNFMQDFWIEVSKKEGSWHIRPAKGCGIIPTAGVQKALDLVFEAAKKANFPEEP